MCVVGVNVLLLPWPWATGAGGYLHTISRGWRRSAALVLLERLQAVTVSFFGLYQLWQKAPSHLLGSPDQPRVV